MINMIKQKIKCLTYVAISLCTLFLVANSNMEEVMAVSDGAKNNSYPTTCAEYDNINIPIYKEGITDYRITATHPGYAETIAPQPLWTIGSDDGQTCEFKQSGFIDFDEYYPEDNYGIEEPASEYPKEINNDWMNYQYLKFSTQDGTKTDLGANFTVDFAGINGTLEIEALTWNGTEWSNQGSKVFDSSNKCQSWEFSDGTWLSGTDSNNLQLQVVTVSEGGQSTPGAWAQYDQLKLTRRAILNNREPSWDNWIPPDDDGGESVPDVFIDLYDKPGDVGIDITGVIVDKWWRPDEAMTIHVVGGDTLTGAHYFQLYHKVPDTESDFQQVFVLYEDGNARVLPLPKEGEDWIPFGSSVIIGPAQEAERPFVDIDEVTINPQELWIDIVYGDGSTAHLEFFSDRMQTIIDVSDITYNTINCPFATLRSMWVEDGNADVDNVKTQEGEFSIMGEWETLDSDWWLFNREVVSIHNTLSPDIKIEAIAEPASLILLGIGLSGLLGISKSKIK